MPKLPRLTPWFIAAGIAWSLGFVYNNYYGGLISWLSGMYRNKVALADQIKAERRLLIIGGSGVHYTLNAKLMEKELGFPVFNFGLDGNLGLNVIFESIMPQVHPGDIVLLVPEYPMLVDDDGLGERSGSFSIASGKPGIGGIPPEQMAQDWFMAGVPTLRGLVKFGTDLALKGQVDEYYADPITERGDPTKTWERKGKWWQLKIDDPMSPYAIKRITQFREELEAKGATLVLSLPWIYGSNDPKTIASIREMGTELTKIAPTIYDEQSLNIKTDSSLFADTHYHLQPEARITRSNEIVQQLKPILAQMEKQK